MKSLNLQIGNITIKIESEICFRADEGCKGFAAESPESEVTVSFLIKKKAWQLPESCKKVCDDHIKVYVDESHIYREQSYADGDIARKCCCVRKLAYEDTYELWCEPDTESLLLRSNLIPLEEILAWHGGFVLHSSCVAYKGWALLFSAPSGTGKTTQAELWAKYAGAKIINGDRCVLMKMDGRWYACGCIYKGSSAYCERACLPIAGILVLGQAPENESRQMTEKEKFTALYRESLIHTWNSEYVVRLMDILEDCVQSVRMEKFVCVPKVSAVRYIEKRFFGVSRPEDEDLRIVDVWQYLGVLAELLGEGKTVTLTVTGRSMAPFLASGRDIVYIEPIAAPVRAKDIVLFKRRSGQYVLHRVHHMDAAGYFIIGDAQHVMEGPIRREQLLGIVTKVKRNGKWIQQGNFLWDFFAHVWIHTVKVRPYFWKIYQGLAHVKHMVLRACKREKKQGR